MGEQTWDLWIPDAASQGVAFARGRCAATEVMWVHAAPPVLRVEVSDDAGRRLAFGDQLERTAETPMTRLTVAADGVRREDRWPGPDDLGAPVILPGGEIGTLAAWWNAPDQQEWRWSVEFYNHR